MARSAIGWRWPVRMSTGSPRGWRPCTGWRKRLKGWRLMIVALHGLATKHCTLLTDIRIAKETGYQGIEIVGSKLRRYLDTGHRLDQLLPHFEGLPPVGLGYVQDIERQEREE